MSSLKNISLIGASGSLGSLVLKKLQASGRFNIRVLRRPSSSASFPPGVEVIDVSLQSMDPVTEALRGQDALISTLGTSQVGEQQHLIEACLKAGIQRFIPAEFGADLENPKVQATPIYEPHCKIRNAIIEASKTSSLTYTFVHNGVFLDWGIEHGFVFGISEYKPVIIDGGDLVCSTTTMASIADAVVGILDHPSETKNRAVYIEDLKLSQNKFYELAQKIAPSKTWDFKHVSLDDMTAEADQKVAQGDTSELAMVPYLFRAVLDPEFGGAFARLDNELLGLKGKTEGDIMDLLKAYLN